MAHQGNDSGFLALSKSWQNRDLCDAAQSDNCVSHRF